MSRPDAPGPLSLPCLLLLLLLLLPHAASAADTYLGCFKDGPLRALPTRVRGSASMTVEACAAMARCRGQPVYGLREGAQCWIGTDEKAAQSAYGASSGCNVPCVGNASQQCGGTASLSLYLITDTSAPAPSADTAFSLGGCYADGAGGDRRMSPLWSDDRMTPTFCALLAKSAGFTVFGLKYHRECWGSNDLGYATALGTSAGCTAPCLGDARAQCGGAASLSVYQLPPFTKLGCFRDSWDRMLPTLLQTSGLMTAAKCAELAAAGGYAAWGVQNRNQCWAGANATRATSLGRSAGCTASCHADPPGDCGGELATSVYAATAPPGPPTGQTASGVAFSVVGCYRDNIADRALPRLLANDVGMTVDTCAGLAKAAGYNLFALQWGSSCYAGNDEAAAKKHGAAANCNTPCWAHTDAGGCGGTLASSVSKLTATQPPVNPAPTNPTTPPPPNSAPAPYVPPTPAPAPYVPPTPVPAAPTTLDLTPLGCFGDEFGSRAMPVQLRVSQDMTVDMCAQLAYASKANYVVFGVQYASECYASKNEMAALRHGPSQACNMACHGSDPTGTCGGPLANSMYRLPPKPASSPSPPPAPVPGQAWTYQGCYADTLPRVVPGMSGGNPASMSVEECARRAKDAYMTVFALQYGGECYYSDDLEQAQSLGALPEDSCNMPCSANPDQMCGGPSANSLWTIPPPAPPADVPAYESLGCWKDDQVFDTTQNPPSPIKRRMWRRLGQAEKLDSWECAKRAAAVGYPLFGITSGELYPAYGWQCWGAYDLEHVTALGPSDGCTNVCKEFKGADRCGGDYAISLYRLPNVQYDQGAGGRYELLMEFPLSASHVMQVTGRDEFLLIEFLGSTHPPSWDGKNTTHMWVRGNNTARSVLNIRDASCGMWVRLPEGDLAGFSGYFGASGVNEYSVWATMLYHRYQFRVEDFGERAMPFGRWYGGAMLLADGRAYVTGGDQNGPGTPRALGSDIWDPAHKSYVGRAGNMGANEPYLPLNDPLFFASEVGGYYPGLWPLHSGGLLFSQSQTVQVINPATGEALAAAPKIPRNNYWEYPLSGSAVLLQEPVIDPNSDVTLWFVVFGGSYQAAYYKPCSDFALRIRLDVRCSARPCTHAFGAWEVETMPGPRCMLDTAVLPNGKVVLIGGTEEGLSNLEYRPNNNNVPTNEPWIYDPEAPAGRRFRRTGAYTRVARFYHGSHVMTSYGDILCAGSTIAQGFTSYYLDSFDITPWVHGEYRIELYKPPYILGPRPTWASVPAQIEYGASFTVTLAANTSLADIVAIVIADPGTTTHSSNMAARSMQLAYAPAAGRGGLAVTAPANTHVLQPGFYLLFAVSRDDSYSVGAWVRLRGPWGSRPASLPAPSQFVAVASSQFEANYAPWSLSPYGTASAAVARTAAAAATGTYGLSVTAGDNQPIVLAGPALSLTAGTRVHAYLWARAPADDTVQLQYLLLNAANLPAASYPVDAYADVTVSLAASWQFFTMGGVVVNATGSYLPALRVTGLVAGQSIALDDVEVFTLTAADAAASLALVRAGTPVGDQLAPPSAAAPAKRLRRLQQQQQPEAGGSGCDGGDAAAASGTWSSQPELPDADEELKQQLERELAVKLRTGQHASGALAGVKVARMVHAGGAAAMQGGIAHGGHP